MTTPVHTHGKVDDCKEMARIIKAGGLVTPASSDGYPARVRPPNQKQGGLAMSRSLGDHRIRRFGVICTPDVGLYDQQPNDRWLIIASDGLWEFVSSEEAVAMVEEQEDATLGCMELIREVR